MKRTGDRCRFEPALNEARIRFAFPSGGSSTVLLVFRIGGRGNASLSSACLVEAPRSRRLISAARATRSLSSSASATYRSEVERSLGSVTRCGTEASADEGGDNGFLRAISRILLVGIPDPSNQSLSLNSALRRDQAPAKTIAGTANRSMENTGHRRIIGKRR